MLLKNKIVLPVIVLLGFILVAKLVTSNPPQARRGGPSQVPQLNVDVQTIKSTDFAITVNSYGTVKPRTQSILLPQASGQIVTVSENFRAGGFFEKGEVLLTLDDRDLKAEIKISQANLYNAQQALSEEKARGEQAKQDWQRLGKGEIAPDLVLRKPQLLAAQAKLISAEASLDKAKLALERTQVIAPYTGRILTQEVDVGQVISPNTRLAEIYAVDYVEIRLPIKNKDLSYINLPESNRLQALSSHSLPQVTIYSDLTVRQSWQGKVVRTEGAFDNNSQQLFVVAQIDDPYGNKNLTGLPLKIGQYVSAKIEGKVIKEALIIPNKAIYQGTYVYIIEEGYLQRKYVNIAWQNEDLALISSGIAFDQQLVLTPLGQVTSGTPVNISSIDGEDITPSTKKRQGKENKKGKGKNKNTTDHQGEIQ